MTSSASPENLLSSDLEVRDTVAQPEDASSSLWLPWLLAAFLVALTFFSYWPTFSNGFLNYDDDGYVTRNHFIQRGLTLSNIAWAFRATAMANWHPLAWISHMVDFQWFGLHAAGHHASSLALHAVNVVLLFFLIRAGTGFLWRSAVVSALFALHPFNVECVAWVSERKSLLCTAFLFFALFAYGWYVRKPGVSRYLLVAFLFAMGLASKPMIITLPFALLLLDYWPLERLPVANRADASLFLRKLWPLVLEKLPLLALSAASAYITVVAQGRGHAVATVADIPLRSRVGNALWSYLLYILKGLWPVHLAIFYPHPENTLPLWKPVLATVLLLLFSYFCLLRLEKRYLLAGWLWYFGCLVPVIGFVQVGRQAMADRYAYTPFLGLFVIAVWGLSEIFPRLPQRSEILAGTSAVFIIFFAGLTWRETTYWKDSFTVFNHALQTAPGNYIAENNLGQAYADAGKPETAFEHLSRAVQEKPHYGLARYNLGVVLVSLNRRPEARAEFQAAIQYGQDPPHVANAFHNLGLVMISDNQFADARAALTEALHIAPDKQNSYLARGLAEFNMSDYSSAEADFIVGASLSPDAPACYWVGRSREARGNISGAIEAYRQALSLEPEMPEAKEHLAALLSGNPLPFSKSEN